MSTTCSSRALNSAIIGQHVRRTAPNYLQLRANVICIHDRGIERIKVGIVDIESMFDEAIRGLAEWNDGAFVHLTDKQLQTVIEETARIQRDAKATIDARRAS